MERLQYCTNPWRHPITFRVSARQGSRCFCPTKMSLGAHFMSSRGPVKDPFQLEELMPLQYKYWNWCRCIQRKDSAGVILTASWFNDINIGYRFHISTVCHSCCNNVMYFSEENLDISGSAWKNIMLAWHSCWHGLSWYWNYIYWARAVFAPCKHQQPDYGPVLAYHLWHILIFALYKYDSNKCIQ